MLDAPPATLRFHCPNCGAGLRASSREAGTVFGCHLCGEPIRVPRSLPPREQVPDAPSPVPPAAAARAASGVRLLRWGLRLVVLQVAFVLATYVAWSLWQSPVRLLDRQPGDLRNVLLAAWCFDGLLVAAQTLVKWLGYRRCDAAADVLHAKSWTVTARWALLARAAGYLGASVPWFTATPFEAMPPVHKALVQVGHLTWMAGVVFEYGVLFTWHRLLGELSRAGGPGATRPVARYLVGTASLLVLVSMAVSLMGMVLVTILRRSAPWAPGQPPPAVRLDYALLPGEGWAVVAGVAALFAVLGLALAWQYGRVLRAVRAGLEG